MSVWISNLFLGALDNYPRRHHTILFKKADSFNFNTETNLIQNKGEPASLLKQGGNWRS